jgi:toxin HigB-1
MIKSFQHKGLKALFERGNISGVRADQVKRLRMVLLALETASCPDDMDLPGLRLHPLKGALKGYWPVSISGNWRIIFRFAGADIIDVNYVDYH